LIIDPKMETAEELISMKSMFVNFGFPTEASDYLAGDGGMVNMDEVKYLTPKDVEQMLMLAMRPGGKTDVFLPEIPQVVQVGDAGFVMALPRHTHQIASRGHPVPLRAVMNIKLLMFWLKHQRRISRI
jgi:hypothetical protein